MLLNLKTVILKYSIMQYKINKKSKHITNSFMFVKTDSINELEFSDSDIEFQEKKQFSNKKLTFNKKQKSNLKSRESSKKKFLTKFSSFNLNSYRYGFASWKFR